MDIIQAQITTKGGETKTIDNWTSFTFDSDFFLPCDAFSMQLEGPDTLNLVNGISMGDYVQLRVNGNVQCTGYVDQANINYGRNGTVFTMNGRNKFGLISDNGINPFIEQNINESSTYADIFKNIFNPYGLNIIEEDDGADIQARSGGKAGLKAKTSGKGAGRSLSNQIKKQLKPNKGEGYLGFIMRLCSRNGWYPRLSADGNTVMIFPPSYDTIAYKLNHQTVENSDEFALDNNVLNCSMHLNVARNPSVIVGECSSLGGGGQFRIQNNKAIKVNEILGYGNDGLLLGGTTDLNNVNTNLFALINNLKNKGSIILPKNDKLQNVINKGLTLPIGINLESSPMRAEYFYDDRAGTATELQFRIEQKMWQYQTDMFSLHYTVDGFTNNGSVWTNNTMVNVKDDNLGIEGTYWINKVTFNKSRSGGTITSLVLNLPYIYEDTVF